MADHFVQLRSWRRSIRNGDDAALARVGWYACYTRARHEKRVARDLGERGVERFLPVVIQQRQWHDRKKRVEFPLFPGYVFVRITPSEIFDVTCIPSVVSLVMADGKPASITEREIENVRRYAAALSQSGEAPEPHPLVEVGRPVVVTDGPFRDVEGTVVEIRGRSRVLVGVAALGHGFSINVPMQLLRPADSRTLEVDVRG